jgi:hypothetical protein
VAPLGLSSLDSTSTGRSGPELRYAVGSSSFTSSVGVQTLQGAESMGHSIDGDGGSAHQTKSDVSFTSTAASIGQIDADRQQIRAEGAHAHAVELRQRLQPGMGVVVGHRVRDARVPATS